MHAAQKLHVGTFRGTRTLPKALTTPVSSPSFSSRAVCEALRASSLVSSPLLVLSSETIGRNVTSFIVNAATPASPSGIASAITLCLFMSLIPATLMPPQRSDECNVINLIVSHSRIDACGQSVRVSWRQLVHHESRNEHCSPLELVVAHTMPTSAPPLPPLSPLGVNVVEAWRRV